MYDVFVFSNAFSILMIAELVALKLRVRKR